MVERITGLSSLANERPLRPAGPAEASAMPAGAGTDFASTLSSLATDTAQTMRVAEMAAEAGIKGEVPVAEVVNKMLEAERSLQAAVAVRDKVVAAYLELSRMQI